MTESILKTVEISPKQIGARRVTGASLKELLEVLSAFEPGDLGDPVKVITVRRFGGSDVLKYPVDRVHEAIERYDVKSIEGVMHRSSHPNVEFKLGQSRDGFAFRLHGEHDAVDAMAAAIVTTCSRWVDPGHALYHSPVFPILWLVSLVGAPVVYSITHASFTGIASSAILAYLCVACFIIGEKHADWNPYFWFYRPGGFVEQRRTRAKALTTGALVSVLLGFLTNVIWAAIPWLRSL